MRTPEHFVGPNVSFQKLHQRILRRYPLGEDAALWQVGQSLNQGATGLEVELRRIFIETQHKNADWAEARFRVLRQGEGNHFLDGMVVDEEGRITVDKGDRVMVEPWSSYKSYAHGKNLPPTLEQMRQLITQEGYLLFPMTPAKDSMLFWQHDNQQAVLSLLVAEGFGQVEAQAYPIDYQAAPQMKDMLMMAYIRKGKVGIGKFASGGMVLGQVGFWESTEHGLSEGRGYISRVRIDRSKLSDTIFISPLEKRRVVISGGLPMDENHGIEVLRMDPVMAQRDLIAAAFLTFSESYPNLPLVLRFNTYKPWIGEYPRHGNSS